MHQAPHVIYRFLTQCDIKLKEAGKMSGWVSSFEQFAVQELA